MTTTTTNDKDQLTDADRAALQLALDLTLADDPPHPGRVEQVQDSCASATGSMLQVSPLIISK